MALDKDGFKTAIKKLRSDLSSVPNNKLITDSEDYYANGLADAIINLIKTGVVEIIVQPKAITVTGSATTQTNISKITLDGDPKDPSGSTGGIS